MGQSGNEWGRNELPTAVRSIKEVFDALARQYRAGETRGLVPAARRADRPALDDILGTPSK